MKSKYHSDWQQLRIDYIIKSLPEDFFKNKTLLELAPFNGYIGNSFHELGAIVSCIEGRIENVNNIKNDYPHLSVEHADLDREDWPWGNYDIIVNMGLFYHLEKYHKSHLTNCIKHCKFMIFETVINNGTNDFEIVNEVGIDQSLTNIGKRPNPAWIEELFANNSCNFRKITDIGNANLHRYDGYGSPGYNRAMWFVDKIE